VLIWRKTTIEVVVDMSAAPEQARNPSAVRMGFNTWTAAGVPHRVAFKPAHGKVHAGNDGTNAVVWQDDEWDFGREVVATTVSTFERESGFVVDSDIIFNAVDHRWTNHPTPGGDAYDVQNVIAHEAGHFFGLGHSSGDAEATMYPTTPPGETKKRSLANDDIDGIVALMQEIENRTGMVGGALDSGESAASGEGQSGAAGSRAELVGCSAGGGASGWFVSALLLCVIAIAGRRRELSRLLAGLLGSVLLLGGAPASATVMKGLSLDQMTDRSQVVLRGRVVARRAVRVGRLIFTEHTLAPTGCLKGSCDKRVRVRTAGGDLGRGLAMHVDGVAELELQSEVVVFLQRRGATGLRTVGLSQGAFRVKDGLAVRDLRHIALVVDHGRQRRVVNGGMLRLPVEQLAARVRSRVDAMRPKDERLPRSVGANPRLEPALDLGGPRVRSRETVQLVEQPSMFRRGVEPARHVPSPTRADTRIGRARAGTGIR
jgi:hypothetical protein